MRKVLVLLLCLTLVAQANARLVLTGVVTDKQDTKPVEGANVELLRLPDSTAVESIKTSSEGLFMLYKADTVNTCLLYTSPSPRDGLLSRMPSSA